MNDLQLLTVKEVAGLLAVDRTTIWRMLRDKRIPEPVRLSARNVRWPAAELAKWISKGCPCQAQWKFLRKIG